LALLTPNRPGVFPPNNTFNWFPELRQDLIGLRAEDARDWLRQNNFFFSQTMRNTNRRAVERWNRRVDGAIIDVVITLNNNTVLDVLRVR